MSFVIETNRLGLREFKDSDAGVMYEMNLDPVVTQFTGDKPFESLEATQKFIANYTHYSVHGYGRWAVVIKETNEVIGWCGLKSHPGFIDLGYRLLPEQRGFGYATEAAKGCLAYGFNVLEMDEIIGRSMKENKASIRVMQKLGMEFWKIDVCEGIEDTVYYRISKNQFIPSRAK